MPARVAQIYRDTKAWPFEQALELLRRLGAEADSARPVVFETGFGASGLPHIGTFAEVARTTMVRHAFEVASGLRTRLICFSDDMDGLRKVPTNLPNREMMASHLGQPVTSIPDPFGEHESFGAHNNARLRAFLDSFGFDYEFLSSTECYKSGRFDDTLLKILKNYDAVRDIVLPTLGKERRETYSPFLPICPKTGVVLQVPLLDHDAEAGTVTFEDSEGERVTQPVTGGRAKLQWKVDWAMRWAALEVDYEMSGKDLIDSVRLSSAILGVLGGRPPAGFSYELFLDEKGEKISKSKGNGITIEEWLRYGSPESLSLFMYHNPRRAKRLYFDVIPRAVDEYYVFLERYQEQDEAARIENPIYHIHSGGAPTQSLPLSYALLLNLVTATHTDDKSLIWGFISRYAPDATPETEPALDALVDRAINYYRDFVAPTLSYRTPDARDREALAKFDSGLAALSGTPDEEAIQALAYGVGKEANYEPLRDWFRTLYECLLGRSHGPRIGGFVALYGIDETRALINSALDRS